MSQDQDAVHDSPNQQSDNRPKTPEAAMQIWRDAIGGLRPLDFDQTKKRLSQFNIRIPESLLTYEAFLRALARLQNMRTDLLEIKEVVDEHFIMKERAVKSLQKILVAMSEGKSVAEKEGITEAWLIHLQKLLGRAVTLRTLVYDKLENMDMAIMQLGRQIKVADIAVRTQTIDVMSAVDLPAGWGDVDEADGGWLRRTSAPGGAAAETHRGHSTPHTEGDD